MVLAYVAFNHSILFFFLFLFFSNFRVSTFAQEYTIENYSENITDPISRSQIEAQTPNISWANLVERLNCRNSERLEVFTPYYIPENMAENSLYLLDENQKKISFHLKLEDKLGYELRDQGKVMKKINTSEDLRYIASSLVSLAKVSESSKKLILELQKSPHPVYIHLSRIAINFVNNKVFGKYFHNNAMAIWNYNRQKAWDIKRVPFDSVGASAKLTWNPYGIQEESLKLITLAHELYHVYDSVRGFFIDGYVQGEELERTDAREYRASYFENLVREDFNYPLRKNYSVGLEGSLFFQGKQVWIPNPCIEN